MGETETPHFYDLGISGRVPEPHNQLFLSLETPGYLKQIKKKQHLLGNIMFCKYKTVGAPNMWHFPKRRAPDNSDDPSNQILDMGSISSRKLNVNLVNLCHFETKKQEYVKPRNQTTKNLWNQEAKKTRNFETKKRTTKKSRNEETNIFYFK